MAASWFDRAITSLAPRTAARQILAQQAFETLARGYDGAERRRRIDGWRTPGTSADTEIGAAGALLRDRMRDLVRNNPHAAKAVAVLVNNIIGSGIMPRAASGDEVLDRKVDALFTRWSDACDADGQLDFYGLQTLICREMVEAGEVLVRRRPRRASDELAVPVPGARRAMGRACDPLLARSRRLRSGRARAQEDRGLCHGHRLRR